jgi:branched-chain amino acid transport system substrate-binding protein
VAAKNLAFPGNTFNRRRALTLLAGAGAAGLSTGVAGCGVARSETPRSPLRIGLIAPLTGGPNRPVGADLENGVRLYLQMRGETMSGHPIELVTAEEGDTVETGVKALEQLYSDNVSAVIGVANPDLLPSIRDLVEKTRVPLVAAHGSSADMSSGVYIWRTAFINNEPGRAVGLYLKNQQAGRIGLISMEDSFGKEVISGLQRENSSHAAPVWISPGVKAEPTALAGAVQSLLSRDPAVIFCWLPPTHIVAFLTALRTAGGDQPVYAPGMASESLTPEQLSTAGGLFTAMQYSSDLANPSNRSFSSEFQTAHKRSPTAYAVAAFDAAAVIDGAIALCGDDDITPQRLNQEISNVGQVISPRGNWQFTQGRTPQQRWYLRQIRLDGSIWSNVLIGDLATLG